jgi:hypothetical protein
MKHMRSLLIGFAFLVGIPLCLLASGMSPVALIADFMVLQQIKDTELIIRSVAGIFLWAVWIYGVVNVLVQSFALKRYGSIEQSDRLFRKTTAAFVVALWLFSTQASSKSMGEAKNGNRYRLEASLSSLGAASAFRCGRWTVSVPSPQCMRSR